MTHVESKWSALWRPKQHKMCQNNIVVYIAVSFSFENQKGLFIGEIETISSKKKGCSKNMSKIGNATCYSKMFFNGNISTLKTT